MVDIKKPGQPKISFKKVDIKAIEKIFEDYIVNDKIPMEYVLGISENFPFEQKNIKKPGSMKKIPLFEDLSYFKKQKRLVLKNCGRIDPESLEEYIANNGYAGLAKALTKIPSKVIDIITQSGLRGRGGGGFLTGKKWSFAFGQKNDVKYVVCNADEGDPGAFMDRSVLEGDPHRLLEGMMIAGYAIGACKGYIYCRAEYPLAIKRLIKAIDQCRDAGLLGKNILGSGFDFDIVIKKGAGAFVCGEETALIASIEGKRGMPKPRPPFPAVAGVFNKPTIINNVETLANVSNILLDGPEVLNTIGTQDSKGTKVFALTGQVANSGLIEVPMGISLREIIYDVGGGILNNRDFKAAQIGGPSGGCLPKQCLDTPIDYSSLIEKGAMMGSGGLVVMDDQTCMVNVAKFFINFTKQESCGKCIPCREGCTRLLEMLEMITENPDNEEGAALKRFKAVTELEQTCHLIKDTAACGLGQTAPNPILSTLRWFRDEYEAHVYDRKCPAGKCTSLLTFTIENDKCKKCGLCKKKCPNDAILGEIKYTHYIIQEKCVKCGVCYEVCPFNAIKAE
ncbi:MAG: 4Fe-4S binding protein [Deltaproteobacteria bacterium]|nr:4Fe-4S binding protein [Deltaproteobacteria bacterium]